MGALAVDTQGYINDVAIMQDGVVYCLPRPQRHCHVIMMMSYRYGVKPPITGTQGFLAPDGRFMDRVESLAYALSSGQIEAPKFQKNALFSEDLW